MVNDLAEARALLLEKDACIAELRRRIQHYEMFMRVLSHDLRNPLSTIVTTAELLSRKVRHQDIQEMVLRIERNGQRMNRMLEQLLDVTRIRAGTGLRLLLGETDLESICRQVKDELAQTQPDHHIALQAVGSAIGMWDADRLSQVAYNLIGNAVEHTTNPRTVRVRLDGTRADAVSLTVHNDGTISPALLESIFDPFDRRVQAQRKPQGLGFGLFISREIARAHGGDVSVASSDEEGTRFVLDLPRASRR